MAGHGQPDSPESAADKARMLREEGLTVIPLGSPNEAPPRWFVDRCGGNLAEATEKWPKTPRIKWQVYQQIAVSDEQFESWVMQYPGCNWAILTGKLVVVDADSAESVAWCDSGAITRSPRRVQTAKGCHFYYAENPRLPIRNTANPAGKIDTRGHGGYVVAPGSVHATGVIYTEETLTGWGDVSLSELPMLTADDLQAIKAHNGVSVSPNGETLFDGRPGNLGGVFDATAYLAKATGEPVPVGGRNNAAASLVGQYIRAGDDLRTVKAKLDAWNGSNPAPLPQAELNTTIASVAKTHARNTGEAVALVPGVDVSAAVAAELPPLSLQAFDACDLQNEAVEPVEWAWENWLPKRYTSGIFAEGGTGKSLLALQLAVCRAAQIPFIDGQVPPEGKTLLLFCEDDRRIVNMRLHKIMARYALPWSAIQGKIKILCRVGDDNSLMSFDKGAGTLTPFWHQLRALLATERADLLVLDTRNDTFTGNEIDGNQVRQFITRAMTSLAQEFNLAAVFLSHVSVSGKSTGTGISGHGQWRDAARSQIYLHRNELLPTISVNRKKANHASANQSDTVQIYNDSGFLIPEMDIDLTQQIDEIARDAFLKILDIQLGYGTPVSSNIRANDDAYAPKVFHQYAKNTRMNPLPTVEDFTRAIQQLEQEGLIRIGSDPRGKAKFLISRAES